MASTPVQQAQILAALAAAPLDRIRLMKTLFLAWHRSRRPPDWPFVFQPYLYGPCAFEVYGALKDMQADGLIVQPPHPVSQWAPYHLTQAGRRSAPAAGDILGQGVHQMIRDISRWAGAQGFRSLLTAVYQEAPDFAVNSVAR